MIGEIDFAGIFVSPLLPCLAVAFILRLLLTRLFVALGVYRYVWHKPLFDVSIFFALAGAAFLLLRLVTE